MLALTKTAQYPKWLFNVLRRDGRFTLHEEVNIQNCQLWETFHEYSQQPLKSPKVTVCVAYLG